MLLGAGACGSGAEDVPEPAVTTDSAGVPDPEDAGDPPDAAQSAADELVEEASEAGEQVDDAVDDEVTLEGGATIGESLPDGFPEEIPVAQGEVLTALSFDDDDRTGYTLGIQADGEVLDVTRDLSERFASAGYELGGLPDDLSSREFETYAFTFSGDAWQGNVIIADNDTGTVVTYAIASPPS